jgi:hypothetical protein
MPLARLKASAPWTEDVGGPLTRVIGLLEVLAALGLVLPGVTHIEPRCSRTRTTSGRTDAAISVSSSMARLLHPDGPALLTNPLTEGLVA